MPRRRRHLLPYQPLHRDGLCSESEQDFRYMQNLINIDPRCIVRHQKSLCGYECPPVMAALYLKHFSCMEFILQRGGNNNRSRKGDKQYTAMKYALQNDSFEGVELLLKYGADPNFNFGYGSLLGWTDNSAIKHLLLKYGANPDDFSENNTERNAYYRSHLARALISGNLQNAKLLLLYGAITDYSAIKQVPLQCRFRNAFSHCIISVYHGRKEKTVDIQKKMFDLLQEFGVNIYQQNKLGITVFDVLKFRSIGDNDSKVLLEYLLTKLSMPLSLLCLARNVIRQSLGRKYLMKISIMEDLGMIPKSLVPFLNYSMSVA